MNIDKNTLKIIEKLLGDNLKSFVSDLDIIANEIELEGIIKKYISPQIIKKQSNDTLKKILIKLKEEKEYDPKVKYILDRLSETLVSEEVITAVSNPVIVTLIQQIDEAKRASIFDKIRTLIPERFKNKILLEYLIFISKEDPGNTIKLLKDPNILIKMNPKNMGELLQSLYDGEQESIYTILLSKETIPLIDNNCLIDVLIEMCKLKNGGNKEFIDMDAFLLLKENITSPLSSRNKSKLEKLLLSTLKNIPLSENPFLLNSGIISKLDSKILVEVLSYLKKQANEAEISEIVGRQIENNEPIKMICLHLINRELNLAQEVIKNKLHQLDHKDIATKILLNVIKAYRDEKEILPHLTDKLTRINPSVTLKKENIVSGPQNKNISSLSLEYIGEIILKNPTEVELKNKSGALYAKINGVDFNLSEIFKKGELAHIDMSHLSGANFSVTHALPQDIDDKKYFQPLSPEEKEAIYQYTGLSYTKINDMLYEKVSDSESTEAELKKTFLTILFLASALNKIKPSYVTELEVNSDGTLKKKVESISYRGETHVSEEELHARMRDIEKMGSAFTKQSAFMSTSEDKLEAEKFSKESLVLYDMLYGKNVAQFSANPKEKEYLMLPGLTMWESFKENNGKSEFQARVVDPLLKEKEMISADEIDLITSVNGLMKNLGLESHGPSGLIKKVSSLVDNGLLKAIQFVDSEYLNKPYSNTSYTADWSLDTNLGIINRPNHGLNHTLRVLALVPVVANACQQDLSKEEIKKIQLASLFFVVGRENDCGYSDNPALYLSYRKKSAEAFKEYAQSINKYGPSRDSKILFIYSK